MERSLNDRSVARVGGGKEGGQLPYQDTKVWKGKEGSSSESEEGRESASYDYEEKGDEYFEVARQRGKKERGHVGA